MDLLPALDLLRQGRLIFHSEADFQFALCQVLQHTYPAAEIRLEYPPPGDPNKSIDILLRNEGFAFPIELKYKTGKLSALVRGEQYNLKNHGAQDLGMYDFVKDLCRVESFSAHLDGFRHGYVLWLTNDPRYWNAPNNPNAVYAAFSVHQGARKTGVMHWGERAGAGTTRGREKELLLRGEYEVAWEEYSNLSVRNGIFKYALLCVD